MCRPIYTKVLRESVEDQRLDELIHYEHEEMRDLRSDYLINSIVQINKKDEKALHALSYKVPLDEKEINTLKYFLTVINSLQNPDSKNSFSRFIFINEI